MVSTRHFDCLSDSSNLSISTKFKIMGDNIFMKLYKKLFPKRIKLTGNYVRDIHEIQLYYISCKTEDEFKAGDQIIKRFFRIYKRLNKDEIKYIQGILFNIKKYYYERSKIS